MFRLERSAVCLCVRSACVYIRAWVFLHFVCLFEYVHVFMHRWIVALRTHKDTSTINFVIPAQPKTVNSNIHHSASTQPYFLPIMQQCGRRMH